MLRLFREPAPDFLGYIFGVIPFSPLFRYSTVISDGYQMTFHHLTKLLTPAIPVLGQIAAGEAHPDLYVIVRDEEADIT
jgi:hypothetical protein